MNWLEIINVYPARPQEKIKVLEICSKIRVAGNGNNSAELKVYGSSFNPELSIHINWTSQSEPQGKSPLGRALSRAFSDLGLVSHTLWVEYGQSASDKTN